MQVSHLMAVISHVQALREQVVEAHRAISHGGSPMAMLAKQDLLEQAERQLAEFLNQGVDEAEPYL
jgi:hypothetical protein